MEILKTKTKSVHFFYEIHISNVIGKLGVKSRTQAIIILVKNGMISI
jgi:DNA-binding NarL/FixJ family response regulator